MFPKPSADYVSGQIARFEDNPRYQGAETTAALVFGQWPRNTVYEEVLAKVIVLNRLYSTNIYDPYTVAQHILDRSIDERLKAGDITLVPEIAAVKFTGRDRTLLSFASKYSSWHQPNHFQIFDSYVEWLLWEYQKQFQFASFRRYEMREYLRFVQIINQFRQHFGLEPFSRKALDKFLWIEGVEQWKLFSVSDEAQVQPA